MIILTFEEFNNKFNKDNKATSNIEIENIGRDISLIPIEIVMRVETLHINNETKFNIIVNLHPIDGTHWVLIGDSDEAYYFDSFAVETPPIITEEYVLRVG